MSVNVVGKDGVIITKKQDKHTQKTRKKTVKDQKHSTKFNVNKCL